MTISVRFGVVFQIDGLDLDGVCEDLKKYGEVTEVQDNELNGTPVKIVFMESDFGKFTRFKLNYNAVPAEDCQYILFPMESMEAKMEVMRARK